MITKPRYLPTDADRNTVRIMAAAGISQEHIALCIASRAGGHHGISETTLRKHFDRELKTAYHMANAQAVAKLFEAVNRGEGWAVCFWLKCRARWQEVVRYEHTGADSGPVTIDINASDASPREILRSRVASIAAGISPQPSAGQPVNGAVREP